MVVLSGMFLRLLVVIWRDLLTLVLVSEKILICSSTLGVCVDVKKVGKGKENGVKT